MTWLGGIFAYIVVWWTVLFAILPLGVKSYHQSGVKPPPGCDPGAPVQPNLLRKFVTTSWISAIVLAMLWAVLHFRLIPLDAVPVS